MKPAPRTIVAAPAAAVLTTREAWTEFWADPAQTRCSDAAPEIWQSLTRHWIAFAHSLAPGARVLDIGCGAGIVGRLLLDARPDLRVTGIDSASVPASALDNLELLSGVAMESLPFGVHRFDAVVSQFGFEYGDTHATVAQLARVLAKHGRLSLLAHHSGSAIVAANAARGAALSDLRQLRAAFCAGNAAAFERGMSALLGRHHDDALLPELARTLPAHLTRDATKRAIIWNAIEIALSPERRVCESLATRRIEPAGLDGWSAPLRKLCVLAPLVALLEPDGTPIAWRIEGSR